VEQSVVRTKLEQGKWIIEGESRVSTIVVRRGVACVAPCGAMWHHVDIVGGGGGGDEGAFKGVRDRCAGPFSLARNPALHYVRGSLPSPLVELTASIYLNLLVAASPAAITGRGSSQKGGE